MTLARENELWNIVYGNCGFTNYSREKKESARRELCKWFKSKEYRRRFNELKTVKK